MLNNEEITEATPEGVVCGVPASLTLVALLFFGFGLLGMHAFVTRITSARIIDIFGCLVSLTCLYIGWGLLRKWPVARTNAKQLLVICMFLAGALALFVVFGVLGADTVSIGSEGSEIETRQPGSHVSFSLTLAHSAPVTISKAVQLHSQREKLLFVLIWLTIEFVGVGVFFWMLRVLNRPDVVTQFHQHRL
jgi:hypothetical protein